MRVRFEGVTKRFAAPETTATADAARTLLALDHIDLDVADGECLVLLGPSGCGKTTLLRLLAGLEELDTVHGVDGGAIWIGDRRVDGLEPAHRDVAMVFQNYALYPHLSVFDNIAFPLRTRRVAAADIDRRVRETAARVGLDSLLARRPAQLSGGQQQRVALARAMVRQPAVYLMDEPLSNLDAQLRLETRTELKRLQRELGTTMIYVTHDQGEAMTLGDRIALMQNGRLVQVGRPLDLYRRPNTKFVASFLGSPSINMLPAHALSIGDVPGHDPTDVELGVRPEDVRLSTTAVAAWTPVTVMAIEPLGNETLVVVEYAGTRVVARAAADLQTETGATVWITMAPERVLKFERASGMRVE